MNRSNPKVDRNQDERVIRSVEESYDSAWGAADIDGLVSVLESDVSIISPMGETSVGRVEAKGFLQDFLSGPGFGSTHTSRPRMISFVSDDVALFDGRATIAGPNLPKPLVHDFTDVFIRRDGRWRIAHIRAYVFMRSGAS